MRLTKKPFTATELRLLSAELQRNASELHALAKLMDDAGIDELTISRVRGMLDAVQWSRQFADDGHRAYLSEIVGSKDPKRKPAKKKASK